MNNDYEMDGASFSSRSETDFLSFLNEREDNAQWLEEEIKVMKLKVQAEGAGYVFAAGRYLRSRKA